MATPAQIKKLHALATALALDEVTYRENLAEYCVKTSKDRRFTAAFAAELIKSYEKDAIAMGVWQPRQPAKRARVTRRPADDPQSVMLRALWIQLHQAGKVTNPAESALIAFAKRLTRKEDLRFLSNRDVTTVKTALVDWLEREEKGGHYAQKA